MESGQQTIHYEDDNKNDNKTNLRPAHVSSMETSTLPAISKNKGKIVILPNKPIGQDYQTITKPVAIVKPRTKFPKQENEITLLSNSTPNEGLNLASTSTSNNNQTSEEQVENVNNPNLTTQNERRRRPVRVIRKFAQNAVVCAFSLFCL
jgi:hypothetical protein